MLSEKKMHSLSIHLPSKYSFLDGASAKLSLLQTKYLFVYIIPLPIYDDTIRGSHMTNCCNYGCNVNTQFDRDTLKFFGKFF